MTVIFHWAWTAIAASFFVLVSSRIVIEQSTIDELVDKASVVESIAQRQRDLIEDEEALLFGQDPEVTPGFYEGDLAGIYHENELGRVGINFEKFPDRRWPNNTIHYLISHLYYPEQYRIVKTALDILDFFTCIDFKEWDGKEPDYLIVWPVKKPAGCWSYVGRLGGPQIVSLQAPDRKSPQCFAGIGRPLHEIMHALGVYHEQSRPDRDKYINVVKTNVIKGFINNFDKLATRNVSIPFEYDYNSIMHYGVNFFSVNRTRPTLVTKQKGLRIGQRINLSKLDCLKLNSLYGCLDDSNPFQKRKYETICDFLGLESTFPKKKSKGKEKIKSTMDKEKMKTTTPKSTGKGKPTAPPQKPKGTPHQPKQKQGHAKAHANIDNRQEQTKASGYY
ncbi:Zinc metalloproteinase nas-4 [Orchesella cincta]|uniref:Metalloendopeptidase n=1 Tax=Orchesella cincta TaxID=48709 RepID=A0A1D2MX98_ORCCI|nr:Zinc metalloproteinase nas-4 [Orchesella cincta]